MSDDYTRVALYHRTQSFAKYRCLFPSSAYLSYESLGVNFLTSDTEIQSSHESHPNALAGDACHSHLQHRADERKLHDADSLPADVPHRGTRSCSKRRQLVEQHHLLGDRLFPRGACLRTLAAFLGTRAAGLFRGAVARDPCDHERPGAAQPLGICDGRHAGRPHCGRRLGALGRRPSC